MEGRFVEEPNNYSGNQRPKFPETCCNQVGRTNTQTPQRKELPCKSVAATAEKNGGKYIVRRGKTEVLEGDWKPKRIVVLEFQSAQRAREWLNCEEYREPRKMRHRIARTNMILVEGHDAKP